MNAPKKSHVVQTHMQLLRKDFELYLASIDTFLTKNMRYSQIYQQRFELFLYELKAYYEAGGWTVVYHNGCIDIS